jgi:uncharacterized protein (DUF1800 family)
MTSSLAAVARRKPKRRRPAKNRGKNGTKAKPKAKPKKPTGPKPKPKPKPQPKPPTKPKPPTVPTPPLDPTGLLVTPARHLANRFSYGITPALAAEIAAAGGHLAWFDTQLDTAYDGSADLADWWPDLHLDAATIYQRQTDKVRGSWELAYDHGRRTMVRRITSPKQVLEVMTEFWENHFHVPVGADNIMVYRAAYADVIRNGALGRFEDLLKAAVLHPAMGFYLGNTGSTKKHPNENLGRELLELHTLGVGNHTEDDVKSSARILTGWRAKTYSTWEVYYSATDHWTGPVTVQGFTDPNTDPDGRDLTYRYLSYLAQHPATARRIATKLVKTFVSDDVPSTLVDHLAATYLANDTQIKPVLRALVRSPEFASAVDAKIRDADEDVAATYRILGITPHQPTEANSAANAIYWQVGSLGLAPYNWPRPDGQPVDAKAWTSPTRLLASMSLHWNMAGRWWPTKDMTFTLPPAFLPAEKVLFSDFVDHLSRVLLHRPASSSLLQACCAAAEKKPTDTVTASSDVLAWRWPRLVAAVLDSPAFYLH